MALVSKTFSQIITFTRASTATYFDATGTLQSAAINDPRLDYNPSTLAAQGLLIEEARTNGIRNNTMQGAVAGTPGTGPTNWTRSASPTNGISSEIIGVGTQAGVTYVDIRFYGTATATSVFIVNFEASNQISAAPSQSWTGSLWARIISGSIPNQFYTTLQEFDSGNNFLRGADVVQAVTATWQRFAQTVTTGASCAFVRPAFFINYSNGQAIDITLRIGLPQLEQGAFATSVIPTTTTALTRSADVASVNTLSPWFNATEGTLFGEVSYYGQLIGSAAETNAFGLDDGTSTNLMRLRIVRDLSSPQADVAVVTSSVNQMDTLGLQPAVANTVYKRALAYALNNAIPCINGSLDGGVDTSFNVPSVNRLVLSYGASVAMYIRRITYYPRRLSNAELQAITA